jgi:HopA1 effector protein family
MTGLHADLLRAVDSVEILTTNCYQFLGQEVRDLSAEMALAATASAGNLAPITEEIAVGVGNPLETATPVFVALPLIVSALAEGLYSQLYIRPGSVSRTGHDILAQRDLVAALSAANAGEGAWEPGWRTGEVDDAGQVAVNKDGLTFWVPPSGLRTTADRLEPGQLCRVRVAKELRNLMPGYYAAIGNGDPNHQRDETGKLVRFYWHLMASGAVLFIAEVTTILNTLGIPFRVKVLNEPSTYQRADAGVLYIDKRFCHAAREAIVRIHRAVSMHLRPEIPLFTKPLAPGLGLAEDPDNGLSFGQHRCQLVAQALWQFFTRPEGTRADTLATVFRQAGLDPMYPYLEPGSTDCYAFQTERMGRSSYHGGAAL